MTGARALISILLIGIINFLSGKWSKVERFDCPVEYLQKLLTCLTTAFVNKVGKRSHWRPPMWKPRAQYISWKCFEMDEVRAVFDKSCIPLAMTKAFNGQEVADNTLTSLGGASAIALVKAQARGSATRQQQQLVGHP